MNFSIFWVLCGSFKPQKPPFKFPKKAVVLNLGAMRDSVFKMWCEEFKLLILNTTQQESNIGWHLLLRWVVMGIFYRWR